MKSNKLISEGLQKRKKNGKRPSGACPFGYKLDKNTAIISKDVDEQKIIERIKKMREKKTGEKKMSFLKIADELNILGLKTKRGKLWNSMQIKNIVDFDSKNFEKYSNVK